MWLLLVRRLLRLLCCPPLGALLLVVYDGTGNLVSSDLVFPGYFHSIRPSRGPGSLGLGTGGTRKVLRNPQGVTEHVKRRSVQNGFPFGFLRQVLMFMSTFLTCLVLPSMFSRGLL